MFCHHSSVAIVSIHLSLCPNMSICRVEEVDVIDYHTLSHIEENELSFFYSILYYCFTVTNIEGLQQHVLQPYRIFVFS